MPEKVHLSMDDRFLLAQQRRFNVHDVDAPTGTSYQTPRTDFFRHDSNIVRKYRGNHCQRKLIIVVANQMRIQEKLRYDALI